jgi:hypothetical protein
MSTSPYRTPGGQPPQRAPDMAAGLFVLSVLMLVLMIVAYVKGGR